MSRSPQCSHPHTTPLRKRSVSLTGEVSYTPDGAAISLGNNAKSVDTGYVNRRARRFALLDAVRKLLPDSRTATCMHRCSSGGVVVRHSPSTGAAGYQGVATCGSVWVCPVCAARVANQRRAELNQALAWGREHGLTPVMLTLTTRHGIDDDLGVSLARLKAAKKRFHQSRSWRAFTAYVVGHVTATEVTHGRNGWHPHYHVVLWLRGVTGHAALDLLESARDAWTLALANEGLDCNAHGYQVQGADQVGDYVTKWGAGEELTLSGAKRAGESGRNPLQLLADYADGDAQAGVLYQEFAGVFAGRRQLVWSRGFKSLVGIVEVTDEDAAAAEDALDMEDLYYIGRDMWLIIVQRGLQAELLAVAEEGVRAGDPEIYIECWLDALVKQWEGY